MAPKKATKQAADPPKSILINDKNELTVPFTHALKRIFQQFSEGTNALTSSQLNRFSEVCNDGKGFTEQELTEIHSYFQCDENKGLTQVCVFVDATLISYRSVFCSVVFVICTIPKQAPNLVKHGRICASSGMS